MYNYPLSLKDSEAPLKSFFNTIKENIQGCFRGNLELIYNNNRAPLCLLDIHRMIYECKFDDVILQQYKNLLLSSVSSVDKISWGAGIVLMLSLIQNDLDDDLEISSFYRSRCSSKIAFKNCHSLIKQDSDMFYLLRDGIIKTGANGSIKVEKPLNKNSFVNIKSKNIFNVTPPPTFFSMLGMREIEVGDCKSIAIDGKIETVGEIHYLLDQANNQKEKILLFAHGFSEEVIATLATNVLRGTLFVVPVHIPLIESHISVMHDISAVTDIDIISSEKGQLISAIKLDDLKTIHNVHVDLNKISIAGSKDLSPLISRLTDDLLKSNYNETKIINERIKSLSNLRCEISYNCNILPHIITQERMRDTISFYNEHAKYGIVNLNLISNSKNKSLSSVANSLIDMGFQHYPYSSFSNGLNAAKSLFESYNNIGTFIIRS